MTTAQAMFLGQIIGLGILALAIHLWYDKLYYKLKGKRKCRPTRHTHRRNARNNARAA
jgi:hypothetical protein